MEEQADIPAMERSGSGQRILINQQPNELLTTEVIGSPVYNESEEKVGSITALIVDDQQQSVVGGLVSVGGFLGIGAKEVGVAWNELEPLPDREGFRLAMSKEELTDAASYLTLDSQKSEQEAAEAQEQLPQQPVAPAAPQ
jgi:sporulation protein YlmC with PRC-barrel domain